MDIKILMESLHALEIKVLPSLKKYTKFEYLVKDSNLKEVEVMRALQWLENKKVLKIFKEEKELVELDVNGKEYVTLGLPEKRLLIELDKCEKSINEIESLKKEEVGISIGALKSKAAILMNQGKLSITPQGKALLKKEFLEEAFLKKQFPLETSVLKEEEVFALNNLKKRKQIIKVEKRKIITVDLTDLGKQLITQDIKVGDFIDRLTPKLIKSGEWKNKKFRRYDVSINVPQIDGGKRHFVSQALEYAKQVWMDMGFKEMVGQKIQTSFWNFDTLFTPQDHPVREMQDTFFIKTVEKGKLPDNKKLIAAIKDAHENGVQGNLGWGGNWNEEIAKTNVLRTHTTCLSAKTLSNLKKEDFPAKFFALGRCFRNESLDWSHLFEFNQTEGIVVDPNANFKNLLGYLNQFFKKMGFEKVRFRPAYFPYTFLSTEIDVFHEGKQTWLELGGAGIFRPELTIPLLGEEVPVLAWGPGFDRIIMDYYQIKDLRELYSNNLKQLRKIKAWNQ